MKGAYQTSLLISAYEKAMESFVRLAQFNEAGNIEFKSEIDNFDEVLAHHDLVNLALMLRKLIEMCGLERESETLKVSHNGFTYSLKQIISRIIHSTECDIFRTTLEFGIDTSIDPIQFIVEHAGKETKFQPVVRVVTKKDGITMFQLVKLLHAADDAICSAVEHCALKRIFLERSVRLDQF